MSMLSFHTGEPILTADLTDSEVSVPDVSVRVDGQAVAMTPAQARAALQAISALLDGYTLTPTDDLLSPNEAGELLGVSRTMVLRWIEQGLLIDEPVGSHHKIPRRSALELLARRREAGRQALADVADPAHRARVTSAREQLEQIRAGAS